MAFSPAEGGVHAAAASTPLALEPLLGAALALVLLGVGFRV